MLLFVWLFTLTAPHASCEIKMMLSTPGAIKVMKERRDVGTAICRHQPQLNLLKKSLLDRYFHFSHQFEATACLFILPIHNPSPYSQSQGEAAVIAARSRHSS